jgi:hypothetical protein
MEASGENKEPAWKPSGFDADALREKLRSLKPKELGDSPGDVAAALKGTLRGITEGRPAGAGTPAAGQAAGSTVPKPPFEERPELYVGAAFAGGLALAGVIRLIAR